MKIVLVPNWFLNENFLINLFSFIVLLVFVIIAYKSYKISKNKKILYLGVGFGLVALAQLSTILTKFVLYYGTSVTKKIGEFIITYQVVRSVDIFYETGFFLYRLLTLIGLYIIYKLPIKKEYLEDFFLTLFFITVISLLSKNMSYLFYFTSLILLVLITKNYYHVYKKNKSQNTLLLVSALLVLAFSNILFAIFCSNPALHVTANIIESVSYIILLFLIIRIWKYGTPKKKPDGHNIRHTGNNPVKGRKHKTNPSDV